MVILILSAWKKNQFTCKTENNGFKIFFECENLLTVSNKKKPIKIKMQM